MAMSSRTLGGDVVVVGAGLIGLAIAFELAERGAVVRVLERAEPGRAASWAGAGMLAPFTERIENEAFLAFCAQSLAAYPAFAERVQSASSVDPYLRLEGILNVAFDDEQYTRLREHAAMLRTRGVHFELLGRRETLEREPSLGAHVTGSLLLPDEGCVDNRRLGRALAAACEARGVLLSRNAGNLAIECDDRRVLGVRSDLGFAAASIVVNAAGAWAAEIPGVPQSCRPPVEPIKGQMLALGIPRNFVTHTTWVPGAYLVPRSDGRLLVGATVERAGFDERVTAEGIRHLLDAALDASPSLGSFTITETWAGLRPGTPDELPFIGRTPIDGLLLATGHFRNGILLAPATAEAIGEIAQTGACAAVEPFSLDRLGTEARLAERISSP